jgi:sensor histidine kinase YesM
MNAEVLRLLPGRRWIGFAQLRALLPALWYITLTTLALNICLTAQDMIGHWSELSAAEFFRQSWAEFLHMFEPEFSGLPGLALAATFAPRRTLTRFIALAITALYMIISFDLFFVLRDGWMPTLGQLATGYITTGFCAIVYVNYGWARTTEGTLLKAQIRTATLAAELNRAQLTLLRAQIEPHFLFNTLATVRTLGRYDHAGTVRLLDNLQRYFAAALPRLRQDEVELKVELELIDAYLRIHHLRMGARLSYQLAVAEDLFEIRVPSMMLLTLVENAIKHGVNPSLTGGFILITGRRDGSMLELRVADSGEGMQSQMGSGTGLANVRTRLTMLYGRRATFSISPAIPRGVVAMIRLPMGKSA